MSPALVKILGVDPGLNVTGHATVFDFLSHRSLESTGILSAKDDWQWEERLEAQTSAFTALVEMKNPQAVAIETYVYQGRRSHNKHAMWLPRLVGRFEMIARNHGSVVISIDKQTANRPLGLGGKVSELRVRNAVNAVFGALKAASEDPFTDAAKSRPRTAHEDDAVLAAIAGAQRFRLNQRLRRAL